MFDWRNRGKEGEEQTRDFSLHFTPFTWRLPSGFSYARRESLYAGHEVDLTSARRPKVFGSVYLLTLLVTAMSISANHFSAQPAPRYRSTSFSRYFDLTPNQDFSARLYRSPHAYLMQVKASVNPRMQ
jgi:hypothetical protein